MSAITVCCSKTCSSAGERPGIRRTGPSRLSRCGQPVEVATQPLLEHGKHQGSPKVHARPSVEILGRVQQN